MLPDPTDIHNNIPQMIPEPASPKPGFDWRLVLQNLDCGWPADMIAEATAMRDAENRRAVRK